jgi:hypothetical protein
MDNHVNVPYIVYEGEQARMERHTKRLVIALVISICLVFASNALWLYAWMQYDYESSEITTQTVDVDAKDGTANYIGNNGDIVNGKDYSYPDNSAEEIPEEGE